MKKTIILNGIKINYNLILKNKKNISIKLDYNGEVIVYAPLDISVRYIEDLLVKKQKWIIDNYNKIMDNKTSNKIMFLGKEFFLKIEKSNYEKIDVEEEVITIKTQNTNSDNVKLTLSNWFREQANSIIIKRAIELSNECSLYPSKILIRNQKTRWGSCNTKREIRLNWRLILSPKYVMDYIIIHELSHLKYMNHSSDFWKLVESYNKDYKKAENWLKENGIKIMKIN